MFLKKENYREFRKSLFIYVDGAPAVEAEKFDADKTRADFEKDFFKDIDLPKDPNAVDDFVKTTFEQNFSPSQYEAGIRKMIGGHVTDGNIADRMAKEAVNRYKKVYDEAMGRFHEKAKDRLSAYKELTESIQGKTRKSLKSLRDDIEKTSKVSASAPNPETVAPARSGDKWPYEIPVVGPILKNVDLPVLGILMHSKEERRYAEFQRQNTAKFSKFEKALSGMYLESKQHEDKLNEGGKKTYGRLAGRLKDGMGSYMQNQLEYIYENSYDEAQLKQNLENLRDSMVNYYKRYDANGDGILDLNELSGLNNETKQYIDIIKLIKIGDEAELEKRLESFNFFNHESWEKATDIMTESLIRDAEQNGCEAQLIAFVKKSTKTAGEMDFDTASAKLRGIMQKNAKAGVKETLGAAKKFNDEVNGAVLEGMEESRMDILKMDAMEGLTQPIKDLVDSHRKLILGGKLIPQNIDDSIVAEFVMPSLRNRERLLNDPKSRQKLFQAIQNIKRFYPQEYNTKYRDSMRGAKKLTTNINHPNQDPTIYDKGATLLAMLTLAKEAEWIIKNLDKSQDFKGEKLAGQFDGTEAEKNAPAIGLKFRSVDKRFRTGLASVAEVGGFNGRDLTLGIVKVWAGLTVFLNFMNARKYKDKNGKELGFIGAAKFMATNPYALGAGAIAWGTDRIQQNPEVQDYLSQSPAGRERIATHESLRGLSKKIPRKVVISFINSPAEFSAMGEIMKNPKAGIKTVEILLKQSRDRAAKNKGDVPQLTKEDLKDTVSKEAWYTMPEGNPHMRFLFYEKMLKETTNVRQLKANCENWL